MTESAPERGPDPPGPKGQFYFGSIGELRKNPMDFYTRLALEYGGLARFFYGRKATYLASEPALIEELLIRKKDAYLKNERYEALKRLIGNGLLLSEGETWKRQRAAAAHGFSQKAIRANVPQMVETVDRHLETWRPIAKSGEAVDIEPMAGVITQALIGEWMFGTHLRSTTDRIIEVLRELMAHWPKPPRGLFTSPIPNPFRVRKLQKILGDLDAAYYGAIRAERERGAGGGGGGDKGGRSMLSLLMRYEDDRGGFTDQELRDQLVTLYMAGFETTASSIAWLFYRLSIQPEIKERFYAEADTATGESPEFARFDALDFVRRSIQETLRMYPPAYNFSRVPQEDQTLGGYHIPAGHMVIVAPWATHRLPQYWPEPEVFDPDRFLPEAVAERPRCTYLPFGAGHRTCIGMGLSAVQSQVLVTRLAQRYHLDLVPDIPVEYVPGTVMRPRYGMNMTIRER